MDVNQMNPHSHRVYYREIDGLRGISVLSVLCYHAFPKWVSGGFVGVDVFFVISGFLITQIILQQLEQGKFSLSNFYARRIKRIFPALLIILIAALICGWLLFLAQEYTLLGKHVFSGATFSTNYFLMGESSYFDVNIYAKPLMHLWSLAIEEQFYIFWPCLILVAWRRSFNILSLMLFLGIISFAWNMHLVNNNPTQAFYSSAARFWELLTGSILSWIYVYHRERWDAHISLLGKCLQPVIYQNTDRRKTANPKLAYELFSLTGFVLLGFAIWQFDHETLFPGTWVLIPIAATLCLIIAGSVSFLNRQILTNRIIVWFGLISFPLYLWHWLLLSISSILSNHQPNLLIRLSAVGLSILLSWVTYQWIEKRIRARQDIKIVILLFGIMVSVGLMGLLVYKHQGLQDRSVLDSVKQANQDLHYPIKQRLEGWLCEKSPSALTMCDFDGESPSSVLIGDSHAYRLYDALKAQHRSYNQTLGMLTVFGCPPLLDIISTDDPQNDQRRCFENMTPIIDMLTKEDTVRSVILASRGPLYTTHEGYGGIGIDRHDFDLYFQGEQRGSRSNEEVFSVGLDKTLAALIHAGKSVTYVYDVPELGFLPEECIKGRPLLLVKPRAICAIKKSDFIERTKTFRTLVETVLNRHPSVRVVDLSEALCDEEWCYASKEGRLLYTDDDHLSFFGASYVIDRAGEKFFSPLE